MNALVQANPLGGPQVRLRWTDNANNETSFALERCTVVSPATTCTNFAQIAAVPPRTTGSATVTYFDTTVKPDNTYFYQVWAVNSAGPSANPSPVPPAVVFAVVLAVPAAPTNFKAANALAPVSGPNTTVALSWDHPGGTDLTNFTIQRATNATFTTGLTTVTPGATARTLTQSVKDNTTYYFRIRANNSTSGSSAWTNALPFPIRTGK
jgi:predicted phage tail protein